MKSFSSNSASFSWVKLVGPVHEPLAIVTIKAQAPIAMNRRKLKATTYECRLVQIIYQTKRFQWYVRLKLHDAVVFHHHQSLDHHILFTERRIEKVRIQTSSDCELSTTIGIYDNMTTQVLFSFFPLMIGGRDNPRWWAVRNSMHSISMPWVKTHRKSSSCMVILNSWQLAIPSHWQTFKPSSASRCRLRPMTADVIKAQRKKTKRSIMVRCIIASRAWRMTRSLKPRFRFNSASNPHLWIRTSW